jgi:hypothetical protein
MAEENEDLIEFIHQCSKEFDTLCQKRHEKGQEEYGQFTFLANDVIRMMAEELADVSNYARYHFVKLMFMQQILEDKLQETGQVSDSGDITIGVQAFRGTGDIGWVKP